MVLSKEEVWVRAACAAIIKSGSNSVDSEWIGMLADSVVREWEKRFCESKTPNEFVVPRGYVRVNGKWIPIETYGIFENGTCWGGINLDGKIVQITYSVKDVQEWPIGLRVRITDSSGDVSRRVDCLIVGCGDSGELMLEAVDSEMRYIRDTRFVTVCE